MALENILSVQLCAPASASDHHCLVYPKGLIVTWLQVIRYIYHLFAETEGNNVFCGPETAVVFCVLLPAMLPLFFFL